jgi:hypothetical protein
MTGKKKQGFWGFLLVGAALMVIGAAAGLAGTARADDLVSDHVLAGLITESGTLEIYVAGEPGYEADMWHHVTPAEYMAITQSGNSWNEITWYYGSLPGTVHIDPVVAPEPVATAPVVAPAATEVGAEVSDHVLAGLITDNGLEIYVAGEPEYEPDMWHHITPAEFAEITATGSGWNQITWYIGELPGTIHIDSAW